MKSDYLNQYRQFVYNELIPIEPLLLNHQYEALYSNLDALRIRVKEMGLWAPFLSNEHGGMNMPFLEFAAVSEILGASPLGHYTFGCQAPDIGNIELLSMFGNTHQQKTDRKIVV